MSEEKRFKNLSTYAVVMFLAAVIVIIIAAMADTREEHFENQLSQQTQLNMDIQNQIVALEDENYSLKKQVEEITSQNQTNQNSSAFYQTLSSVYATYLQGKTAEATEKFGTIDVSLLDETQKKDYQLLQNILKLPLPKKGE